MRRFAFAGVPSVPPGSVGLIDAALVYRSCKGLPSASVSNGTAAGMFEPRRRRYCDWFTLRRRNTIALNCLSPGTDFQLPWPNVRKTCALVFFAPSGTVAISGFEIHVLGHWPE